MLAQTELSPQQRGELQENVHFLPFLKKQLHIQARRRSSAIALLEHPYLRDFQPLQKDIPHAIEINDTVYLQKLLERFDVNEVQISLQGPHPDISHPLCYAIYHDKFDCAKMMVEQFAAGINGSKAMCIAVEKKNPLVVEYLVNKGGDINVKNSKEETPLMLASLLNYADMVKFLTSDRIKADVNIKNLFDGRSALHYASQKGHLTIVKHLVQVKISSMSCQAVSTSASDPWSDCDNVGMTELHHACLNGHEEVVKFLVSEAKADLTKTEQPRWHLYSRRDDSQRNPLHFASMSGSVQCIDFLLTSAQMDVHARTKKQRTPFLLACGANHLATETSNNENIAGTVKYLAERTRVDVYATDEVGKNALHHAAMSGTDNASVIKYLVEKCHIDASATDSRGKNALHHAAMSSGRDNIDIIKYLVESCRVDTAATDSEGRNVLHHAAMSWRAYLNVVKYLVETCHVDIAATDEEGLTAEQLAEQTAMESEPIWRAYFHKTAHYLKEKRCTM